METKIGNWTETWKKLFIVLMCVVFTNNISMRNSGSRSLSHLKSDELFLLLVASQQLCATVIYSL